eukprot:TRINITY_DN63679_c0_g1_i1.p1 TRINITY_DN63679_c0_g1~~TRINITY_DN63679_c0_g1_i1.p1  ORF type:complete len:266 (+),score=44.44 TRINITY_DN63679_c0_g1_i1:148-945(+)
MFQCDWCGLHCHSRADLEAHVLARLLHARDDETTQAHPFLRCLVLVAATDPGRLLGTPTWHCPLCPATGESIEVVISHWDVVRRQFPGHDLLIRLVAALLVFARPPADPSELRRWAETQGHLQSVVNLRMFLALLRPRRRIANAADLSPGALRDVLNQRGVNLPPSATKLSDVLMLLRKDFARERRERRQSVGNARAAHGTRGRSVGCHEDAFTASGLRTKRRRVVVDSDGGGIESSSTLSSETDTNNVRAEVILEVVSEVVAVE